MKMSNGGGDPVILATAGYDHTVRFWEAHTGFCHRTVQHPDSVSFNFHFILKQITANVMNVTRLKTDL